jgi:hypothetical protein
VYLADEHFKKVGHSQKIRSFFVFFLRDDAEGKRLRYKAYARRFLKRIDKAA